MELKEAKKILKDDGYVISYSDLEDKTVHQMEDLVRLANVLANAVHYFMDSDNDYEIVKLGAYGYTVKNMKFDYMSIKIGLMFTKFDDYPKIKVEFWNENEIRDAAIYDANGASPTKIFKDIDKMFKNLG